MDSVLQDVRYALHGFRKSPGFTAVAVLTLALGIGANTAIFSVVNALLLRPLTADRPEQLLSLRIGGSHMSYPNLADLRESARQSELFVGLAAYRNQMLNLGTGEDPRRVFGQVVTSNYFQLLGVNAIRGRTFAPGADTAVGATPEVVVSYGFWQRELQGAEVGTATLRLNGQPVTVVGVMPEKFTGTYAFGLVPDLYVPLNMYPALVPGNGIFEQRERMWLEVFGRTNPGVARETATAAVSTMAEQLRAAHREQSRTLEVVRVYPLTGLGAFQGMSFAPALFLFMALLGALVGTVLLIACANLANLLLVRGWRRRKEIAVRVALGATRGRLLRQLLTESVLLGIAGGAAGTLLAAWLAGVVHALRPPVPAPIAFDFSVDLPVLAFSAGLSTFTGILFGLAPALRATRVNLLPELKAGAAGEAAGGRRFNLRNLLVAGQIAASLVLLVCAGLFLRSLQKMSAVDPGFNTAEVLTATIDVEAAGYSAERGRLLYRELIERVRHTPGVAQASAAHVIPLTMNSADSTVHPSDREEEGARFQARFNTITPGYFETMQIALLSGRDFQASDTRTSGRVAVVNQTLAERVWPGESPLGKRLRALTGTDQVAEFEVIGVAANTKYRTPGEDPAPLVYLAFEQAYRPEMALHVRVDGSPAAMQGAIRQAISRVDATLVPTVATMEESVAVALIPAKVGATVLSALGMVGLGLACLGIYGVVSYAVTQRTHEMGVRSALGAKPADLFKLVLVDWLKVGAWGVVAGVLVAGTLAQVLASLIAGISRLDPVTFGVVIAMLLGISLAAALGPARRAARVEPMTALRYE